MTAKERLRQAVDELTEAEAVETLEFLARRGGDDALSELLDQAPIDEEPVSEEEERAVEVARAEIARGETVSLATPLAELIADRGASIPRADLLATLPLPDAAPQGPPSAEVQTQLREERL